MEAKRMIRTLIEIVNEETMRKNIYEPARRRTTTRVPRTSEDDACATHYAVAALSAENKALS